jgi:hypothetical protein
MEYITPLNVTNRITARNVVLCVPPPIVTSCNKRGKVVIVAWKSNIVGSFASAGEIRKFNGRQVLKKT